MFLDLLRVKARVVLKLFKVCCAQQVRAPLPSSSKNAGETSVRSRGVHVEVRIAYMFAYISLPLRNKQACSYICCRVQSQLPHVQLCFAAPRRTWTAPCAGRGGWRPTGRWGSVLRSLEGTPGHLFLQALSIGKRKKRRRKKRMTKEKEGVWTRRMQNHQQDHGSRSGAP